MAILKQSVSTNASPWPLAEVPPKGTFLATCIDIKDEFGVERPSFNDPNVMEKMDRCAFLFGFRDSAGKPFTIASRWMRISGNEKAALFSFLRSWLGEQFPFGSDYAAPVEKGGMLGRKATITINHEPKKDGSGSYPMIVTLGPAITAAAPVAPQPAPVAPPAPAAPVEHDPLPF